ncbi:MAG: hypothetical protein ABIJ03_03415 [Patescibacteria group bacterium]|nr:hypothetical protein [Patescibacteria group bacterium]
MSYKDCKREDELVTKLRLIRRVKVDDWTREETENTILSLPRQAFDTDDARHIFKRSRLKQIISLLFFIRMLQI